jgi:hypothetical protein
VRDYYFFIAFEEAGIWEELALASDGSLPRPGTEGDRLVAISINELRSGIHLITSVGTPELFL